MGVLSGTPLIVSASDSIHDDPTIAKNHPVSYLMRIYHLHERYQVKGNETWVIM